MNNYKEINSLEEQGTMTDDVYQFILDVFRKDALSDNILRLLRWAVCLPEDPDVRCQYAILLQVKEACTQAHKEISSNEERLKLQVPSTLRYLKEHTNQNMDEFMDRLAQSFGPKIQQSVATALMPIAPNTLPGPIVTENFPPSAIGRADLDEIFSGQVDTNINHVDSKKRFINQSNSETSKLKELRSGEK